MSSPNKGGCALTLSCYSSSPGYRRMPRWNQIYLGAMTCGFLCASVQAAVVTTSGSSNPTAGGFTEVFSTGSPTITTGPGTDSEAYWQLKTGPFPGDSGGGHYVYNLAGADISDPSGWTFTYRVKPVDADRNFESYAAVVANGGNAWILSLVGGPDASGPGVGMHYYQAGQEGSFPSVASDLPGSTDPSLAYHTYQIIYDPGSNSASFYIDGAFSVSQAASNTIFAGGVGASRLEFGDGQGTGAATGTETRYALVQFETGQHIVPEPSTIAILCLGGFSLIGSSLRRRLPTRISG